MARTQLTNAQVADDTVTRADLNTTVSGSAVIRKVLAGHDVTLTSTGTDAGTGDVTIAVGVLVVTASEALAAGDFVNLHNSSGLKVRKAHAGSTPTRRAHGFVKSAVSASASATVYLRGVNTSVSGFTAEAVVYLSAVAAGIGSASVPTSTGNLVQELGIALSATEVLFDPTSITVIRA